MTYIVGNKVIKRACIMDSETFSFGQYALSAWCIMQYTVYSGLVSCPFYAIPIILYDRKACPGSRASLGWLGDT